MERLDGARVTLAMPGPEAAERVVAYFVENRAHLAPTSPPWPADFFTPEHWHVRLARNLREYEEDLTIRWCIFERDRVDGPILGQVNFTQIFRGPMQACYVGYGLDHRYQGKGMMREALELGIAHAFEVRGIHRIMANHLPTNERSAGLLRRLGFVVEGYARDYLFIDGAWRDHVLTSKTNPTPMSPKI